MTQRVITGAILIAVALLGVVFKGWILLLGLLAVMLLSTHEMFAALENTGARPVEVPAYLFAVLCALEAALAVLGLPNLGAEGLLFSLSGCMLLGMAGVILRGAVDFEALVASIFPIFYPGMLFACLFRLGQLEGHLASSLALALAFFVPSMNDCFALFTGLAMGRHKLSPEISPKKTVEGAVGGLIASAVFGVLLPLLAKLIVDRIPAARSFAQVLPPLWQFALLGLLMGALAQLGDLAASMVKRHCGIKDFGRIFPGHGGVMDRLDGILFGSVACLIFFRLMGM